MKINDPQEVLKAIHLLEVAEKSLDPQVIIYKFEEGIDILKEYIEENPNVSDETKNRIINIKISHTRQLLKQLPKLKKIEIGDWFEYLRVLVTKVDNERKTILTKYPELKSSLKDFIAIWEYELKRALL